MACDPENGKTTAVIVGSTGMTMKQTEKTVGSALIVLNGITNLALDYMAAPVKTSSLFAVNTKNHTKDFKQ